MSARMDDYFEAKQIAVESLKKENLDAILARTGFKSPQEGKAEVPFLTRTYRIDFPSFDFTDILEPQKEVPIQEQVLILHYMMADPIPVPSGKWVSYREIPDASFYFSAFSKRALEPMTKVFGKNVEGLKQAAEILGMTMIEHGDAGFFYAPFPKIPMQFILWEADEDFEANANILFDNTVGEILSAEDIAWLSGMVVYRLMALSR